MNGLLRQFKSDTLIDFKRYECVFPYETLEFYTPEFTELIEKTKKDPYKQFFIVNDDSTCSEKSTKNCKVLMDLKDDYFIKYLKEIIIS